MGTETSRRHRPLVIVGATASGKSTMAFEIARRVDGAEIVSVDSMAVYRGMDVGTASPSPDERATVPHHLIDVVDPTEEFTVGEFQRLARGALHDIAGRDGVAILVGGTGLHVRAIVDDLEIPGRFPSVRDELDADPDTHGLHRRLTELDPVAAARMDANNRRRVVRALEVTLGSGRPFSSFGPGMEQYPPTRFVQVGITWPREELDRRIALRYDRQMTAGFLAEAERLAAIGPGRTAAQALGYRELMVHLRGDCTLDEALDDARQRTRRFARRQERWFRRDPRIRWVDGGVDPDEVLATWDAARATPVGEPR